MYQLLAFGSSEMLAKSFTCCTHPACAVGVASIDSKPSARRWARQSAIQSTCCSIDTIMFDSTDGLPGPVIMNRFGNPSTISPR